MNLIEPSPRAALDDLPDGVFANAEWFCDCAQRRTACMKSTYLTNGVGIEFGLAMLTSTSDPMPDFDVTVGRIIRGGSEKEMAKAKAGRIIAAMENHHTFRNRAILDYPSDSMHPFMDAVNSDVPVSLRIAMAGPNKTLALLPGIKTHPLARASAGIYAFRHGAS